MTLMSLALAEYSCATLLRDTLVGHSCKALLCDILVGHFCGTLVWGTIYSFQKSTVARLPPKVTRQVKSPKRAFRIRGISSKSHASSLQNERFVRDFFQKSRGASARLAAAITASTSGRLLIWPPPHLRPLLAVRPAGGDSTGRSAPPEASSILARSPGSATALACIVPAHSGRTEHCHTRLPPKVTRQRFVRGFSSKSDVTCQSLQNEHFVRDFLQKSSGKLHRSTRIKQPCQAVLQFQSSKQHPLTRQSRCHSVTATSRFPAPATKICPSTRLTRTKRLSRNVTSATPRNLTIPCACACHENCTSTLQNLRKVLRLPRKVTISRSHV